jgi:hypothetical protein
MMYLSADGKISMPFDGYASAATANYKSQDVRNAWTTIVHRMRTDLLTKKMERAKC